MAEEKAKSLEMRVAELEDKLSKLQITEEEWKTYQKVAGAVGGRAVPQPCIAADYITPPTVSNCWVFDCWRYIGPGPTTTARFATAQSGGVGGGGSFGTLGT